jgi:acetoacetyl-CoA reductase/3-oxoacyl-[acyl-carrier protein] reductase
VSDTTATNRIVVITGAANGIGRATSLKFAADKPVLALLDREQAALEEVAKECRALGAKVLPITIDLLDRPAVEAAFKKIRSDLGPVDVLVNNVGQSARERAVEFHESTPDLWDFLINICLLTTMHCTRQVINDMRERRQGKIVNISSEAALNGGVKSAEYAAAKAGVLGFTRSLAREVGPFNVNVNAVLPAIVATRAYEQMLPDIREKAESTIPMKRAARPEEIADAIYFLASPQSTFVTGHSLAVAGGNIFN